MAKVVKKTLGQMYLDELEAQRAKMREVGTPVSYDMDAETRSSIEAKLGRKLSNREIIQGHLNRDDTRTFAEALEDTRWSPAMPPSDGDDPYASAVREAEEAVRQEQYSKLSAAEKRLFHAKELQQKKLAEAASAEEYRKRLADPQVAAALRQLEDLKNRAAFDPDWSYHESLKIDRAIEQLRTPGALIDEGLKLMNEAIAVESQKRQAIIDRLREHRSGIEAQLAELDTDIATAHADSPSTVTVDEAWETKLEELRNAAIAANDAVAGAEDKKSAMVAVREAFAALDAHKATAAQTVEA